MQLRKYCKQFISSLIPKKCNACQKQTNSTSDAMIPTVWQHRHPQQGNI
jgi:hypothetical protein